MSLQDVLFLSLQLLELGSFSLGVLNVLFILIDSSLTFIIFLSY